jgi:hypothetical protein
MNKTMCPGQDTRYWRPGDIFNVTCSSCGNDVEFFKDDAKRRCGRCGAIVQNPRLSTGCARWCRHARECLGYDPSEILSEDTTSTNSIAGTIIESLRVEFGPDSALLAESLKACERAADLLKSGGANPRVTIPAVLLLMVDRDNACGGPDVDVPLSSEKKRLPVAERILGAAGTDRSTAEDICAIIRAYHSGMSIDSPEYRIVSGSRSNS